MSWKALVLRVSDSQVSATQKITWQYSDWKGLPLLLVIFYIVVRIYFVVSVLQHIVQSISLRDPYRINFLVVCFTYIHGFPVD